MKLSKEKPPNWERISKAFNVEWGGNLVVAYGDTVYHTKELHPSVLVHEAVHITRQKDPVQWWENYIRDSKFRFGEELLAYREQYKYLKDTTQDRNKLAGLLFNLAKDLSGPMYSLPISLQDAIKLIKAQ